MTGMKVIKRDGREVDFDRNKIISAIGKANSESLQNHEKTLSDDEIKNIATRIYDKLRRSKRIYSVEDIQDLIEEYIDKYGCFSLAKRYTLYRYKQSLIRKKNTTDDTILSLIDLSNENIKQENSNKNPTIIPTQRDYMAGEVSKDLTDRVLLPQDIVEADREGIIHFHDKDYFAQHTYNCCLCNLDDMLQNGTVISGTMIEKPHSFSTACTIATQIIAQVASSQYGGQSISLTALAPFVDISRQRIKDELRREWSQCGFKTDENKIAEIAEERLQKEINKGVQTIQ